MLGTGRMMAFRTNVGLPNSISIVHLLVVLVGLMVADGIVSRFIIEYGLGYEGNPLLRDLPGPDSVMIKVAGALLVAIILWDVHKTRPKLAVVVTTSSMLVYTGIVLWNVGVSLSGRL